MNLAYAPWKHVPEPIAGALLRAAALVPWQWRIGRTFWRWRRFFQEARRWSPERVAAWQLERLQRMVRHAYENTEGYRRLYRAAGVRPDDIRALADVKHLPFTTKKTFQDDLEAFTDRRFAHRYATTGGSTGIPFGFFQTAEQPVLDKVHAHEVWGNLGWRPTWPGAVLRGGYVGTAQRPWKYNPLRRTLELSSYQLTERTLPAYVEAIRRYRPPAIQAYPSAMHLLCKLLSGRRVPADISFDLILLGSESVYDWQLEAIRSVFPCAKIFSWYGHAERLLVAPWCPTRDTYHMDPFFGLAELLRDNGQDAEVGEEGELVGTGFFCFATPLIRFRTADRAVRGPSPCPACGHPHLLLSQITGRSHELIVTGTGRLISMTAVNMHDDEFDALRQFQFVQTERGKVIFRYVPKTRSTPELERRLRKILTAKLGDDMALSLCAVTEIPLSRSGKLSFLDQRLAVGGHDSRLSDVPLGQQNDTHASCGSEGGGAGLSG